MRHPPYSVTTVAPSGTAGGSVLAKRRRAPIQNEVSAVPICEPSFIRRIVLALPIGRDQPQAVCRFAEELRAMSWKSSTKAPGWARGIPHHDRRRPPELACGAGTAPPFAFIQNAPSIERILKAHAAPPNLPRCSPASRPAAAPWAAAHPGSLPQCPRARQVSGSSRQT